MKNFGVILCVLLIYLIGCIYFRTGYFESSVTKIETTFYIKGKEPITSKRYYRDLSGNWILLDKNYVITEDAWNAINMKAK